MAGQVTVGGTVLGMLSGSKNIGPLTVESNATAVGTVTDLTTVVGDNTISVPSGALAVVLVGYSNNSGTVTIRTVNGDTGMFFSSSGVWMTTFDPANRPSSLILHAGASGMVFEANFI